MNGKLASWQNFKIFAGCSFKMNVITLQYLQLRDLRSINLNEFFLLEPGVTFLWLDRKFYPKKMEEITEIGDTIPSLADIGHP